MNARIERDEIECVIMEIRESALGKDVIRIVCIGYGSEIKKNRVI